MIVKKITLALLSLVLSGAALGHGLMSEPAARNWLCGAVTKPDQAAAGSACAQAFASDSNGGYQFMSVLTHDIGRKGGRSNNVCGFDSETWQGGATPWDSPINWPTHPMSAGQQTITWDISWGPHFDDTEEFSYWITKPDFQYQVGRALTWDDFEEEPFCDLPYSDANPNGNPDVTPDKAGAKFHTRCNVPARSGRHVIYGEWGRNQWTYERFHGCLDVAFGGTTNPVVADIAATPANATFAGAGTIALSAAGSTGSNLGYQWTIDATNASLYSLSSTTAATTTLQLAAPQAETSVTVRLQVTSGSTTSNDSITFTHVPVAGASWEDLGALTATARTLAVGDRIQVRIVSDSGQDTYLPASPLVITSANAAATAWPFALAQAVNQASDEIQVGVLNTSGEVVPAQNATSNRVYAGTPSNYANAFLEVESANSSSSSSSSSSIPASSSSSSAAGGSQCNWYGTLYPLCVTTQSGWGWESNRSCIAASTCSGQPAPYGIVGGSTSSSPSSSTPSSTPSSSTPSSSTPSSVASSSSSVSAGGSCQYVITNQWSSGFTGAIRITNNGSGAINGWSVGWNYTDGSRVTSSWNATVTGANPYTATGSGWNGAIQPGQTIEFGFQGTKGGSGSAAIPAVTGSVCN